MQENEQNWLKNVIKTLLIRNFYKKFITCGKHRIYLKNLYEFLRKDLQASWIKEKPFIAQAKKMYNQIIVKYYSYKNNERLKELQKKYPKLQIIETYYYLNLHEKFKLKDEDIELFEESLEILLAPLKQRKS